MKLYTNKSAHICQSCVDCGKWDFEGDVLEVQFSSTTIHICQSCARKLMNILSEEIPNGDGVSHAE